jgi:hypothetical protein
LSLVPMQGSAITYAIEGIPGVAGLGVRGQFYASGESG